MTIKLNGHCHCGTVQFEVVLQHPIDMGFRCDCSLCRRKGALMFAVPMKDLTVIQGEDNLAMYQWGTQTAKHYFCKTCGIYTHHQRFIDPTQYSFNLGCLDDINPAELDIKQINGSEF